MTASSVIINNIEIERINNFIDKNGEDSFIDKFISFIEYQLDDENYFNLLKNIIYEYNFVSNNTLQDIIRHNNNLDRRYLINLLNKECIIYIIKKFFNINIIKNIFTNIIINITNKNSNINFTTICNIIDNYNRLKIIFDIHGNQVLKITNNNTNDLKFYIKDEYYPFYY